MLAERHVVVPLRRLVYVCIKKKQKRVVTNISRAMELEKKGQNKKNNNNCRLPQMRGYIC
jgi:hypothetical protein